MPRRRLSAALAALLVSASAGALLASPAGATFPGANGAIAFVRDGDIFTIQPDGTGEKRLTSGPATDSSPDWSPDGREILFERDGDAYVMRADGSSLTKILDDAQEPDWFRDGKRIAFTRKPDPLGEERLLLVANRDGSGVKDISPQFSRSHAPDPSPVSDFILTHFIGDNAEGSLFAHSPGIGRLGWFFPDTGDYETRDGSWAPDGQHIAFRHGHGPIHTIEDDPEIGVAVMDVAGVSQRTIVKDGRDPAWSPDGNRIAYVIGNAIQVARSDDGAGRRTLGRGSQPDWQPLPVRPPVPPETKTVTVTVPGPPPPPQVIERVVTRTAKGDPVCVVPKGKRKFTVVLRAHKAIEPGMGLKVQVDLDRGKRGTATVHKGKPIGLRAGVR